MNGVRHFLENALREHRNLDYPSGRSAERVKHLLHLALQAPCPETVRRAIDEIECCYQSQGLGLELPSLRLLGETLERQAPR